MENISVIMLSHNNQGIDICISALAEQQRAGDELVIVDDHSDDAFLAEKVIPFLEGDNIRLVNVEARGGNRSHNRNLGVKNTNNPILLFVDGDMLLCDNALDILRHGYESGCYAAFIGTEHGMKYTDLHMALYMGETDYCQLARTKGGRAFLYQHPLLSDWRERDLQSPQFAPYYWIYFYTSFCSMTRKAFLAVGGFDESFITWGSEDVDIGYRLAQYGQIGYLPGLDGLHVPHPRNIWLQETCDRDNIRYILDKYRAWPLELLAAFDSSCKLYDQMEKIYHEICQWRLPQLPVRPEPDSLWIDLPGAGRENMTARWFNHSGEPTHAPLLGIALPFCDLRFQNAYLTINVFAYPSILTARILMESLRVSRHVYLCPAQAVRRQVWEDDAFKMLTALHRVCAISCDPMEYSLKRLENGLIEVLAPENRERLEKAFSQAPVFPAAETRRKWSAIFARKDARIYTLVNLIDADGALIKEKLQNALGIQIGPHYNFSGAAADALTLADALPLALCQSAAPLLYIVPDARRLRKGCHWQRDQREDLVFDQTGVLYTCVELGL